jgi:enoyl-CoA hydratase/carnithine racemase
MTDAQVTDPVLVKERRGAVLVLRLNRPEARNALNGELISALGVALLDAEDDDEVRCIVLTGTGDRAFCAGLDLRDFAAGRSGETDPRGMEGFGRLTAGELRIPIVGASQATAVAGGFELLLGCDLVVAAESAMFGIPEVKRALIAAGGGVFISSRIPLAIALELTLTGDPIEAARAYELGLVNLVVPADQVVDAAVELGKRIAANGPLALEATKLIVRAASSDLVTAKELLAEWQAKVFQSNDAKEGATAFVERREPVWTGT